MPEDTITLTDNRTNQTYTLPLSQGAIRAMDLFTGPGGSSV